MNKTTTVLLAVFSCVAMLSAIFFFTYVGKYDQAVSYEAQISRFDKDSQNVLSNYTMKIKEMAQVPDMYKEDLQDVIKATFQGRYGKDGSQAMFQWIQEQNIQFDSTLYTNLQAAMEAGRDEFRLAQTKKIDVCEDYRGYTKKFFNSMFIGDEFPSKGIDKMCQVIQSQSTKDTFESGTDEVIKL